MPTLTQTKLRIKPRWLNRELNPPAPYVALCLSKKAYESTLASLKLQPKHPWVNEGSIASAHHWEGEGDQGCTVVCLDRTQTVSSIDLACILVHESVHIWQKWCEWVGETNPGREQEAYAIESISRALFNEYVRQTTP